jgi:ubiquinone/menaquinone biosynthesis C-methylase UbiE
MKTQVQSFLSTLAYRFTEQPLPKKIATHALTGFSLVRGLHFLSQYRLLELYAKWLTTTPLKTAEPTPELIAALRSSLFALFRRDAENVVGKLYPPELLLPEDITKYIKTFPAVLLDSIKIHERRMKHLGKDISEDLFKEQTLSKEDYPDYFVRNFHFQSDGYLSSTSASFYEHQVEMLFAGSAGAMRRLSISPLKKHFSDSAIEHPKILELACGSGSATRQLSLVFPEANITATELSEPYLNFARERLAHQKNIELLRADATQLPFLQAEYDAVVVIFLFHELPEKQRLMAIQEAYRCLKKGGIFVCVDSLQLGDQPALDVVLEAFPANYHEPYYANYISHPLELFFKEQGFSQIESELGFLSKCVWGFKT